MASIQFPNDLTTQVTHKYNELAKILTFGARGVNVNGTVHMDVWGKDAVDFIEILQEEISEDEIVVTDL